LKYRVSEVSGWFVIGPSGVAENNEPLRVRYLFRRWLAREGVKVIVDLKDLKQFGVWEVGLLTSFKREVDQRAGILRICRLNPDLSGYFQNDRFADEFEIFADLEAAMAGKRNESGKG
jgi:anti-anti-sigma regulatory factor